MKNGKRQAAGAIMTLAGGTYWGFSGYCGQYLFKQKGIEAPQLVAVRLSFMDIVLVLAGFKLHGRDNPRTLRKRRDTAHLLTFAIFGITFCQLTYFMAIQASGAGTAAVLQHLSPIPILAMVCTQGLRLPKEFGLTTIGLPPFGIFIIGIHGDIHSFHITGEALFWDLLAATSSMIYTIAPGELMLKYDIYQVLGFGMFFDGIAMGAMVRPWNYGVAWDADIMGVLTGIAVVGIVIAFGLYLQGVSMVRSLKRSIMGNVEPVPAVVISVLWLGTRLTLPNFLEFALILGAVFVLTFARRLGGKTAKGADFSADP